jgi:hypothetical protein
MGDFLQQLIASLVSEGVVDLLETVEIEKRDRQLFVVAMRLADALAQQLAEEAAVGQSREAIVIGEIFDAFGVCQFGFALAQSALSELPAHATQHSREQHDEDAA